MTSPSPSPVAAVATQPADAVGKLQGGLDLTCTGPDEEARTEKSEFGTVVKFVCFKGEVMQGLHVTWYENRQMKAKGQMLAGHLTGPWVRWYQNGQLMDEVEFVDDKPQGLFKSFHPNGKPALIGQFQLGQKTGEWKQYNSAGRIIARGKYLCDEKVGAWREWDETTKKMLAKEYEATVPCSVVERFKLLAFEGQGTLGLQTTGGFSTSVMLAWTPRFRLNQRWSLGYLFGLRPERAQTGSGSTFMTWRHMLQLVSTAWVPADFGWEVGLGFESWSEEGEYGVVRVAATTSQWLPWRKLDHWLASYSLIEYHPKRIHLFGVGLAY